MKVFDVREPQCRRGIYYTAVVGLVGCMLLIGAAGCGDDDDDGNAVPTATSAPEPTATPDEGHDLHAVNVGSTEDGGGVLAYEPQFDGDVSLPFNACLGGEGDECEGGMVLYSSDAPGFNDNLEEGTSLFPLADGTEIGLEIIAISEGVSMQLGETTLDTPGQSIVLGPPTPEFHGHPEWQVFVPAGTEHDSDFHLSFKLNSEGGEYGDSAVYEWHFIPSDEGDGGHHDDGGDDEE